MSGSGEKAKRCVEKPIAGCSTGYIAARLKRIQLSSEKCKVSSVTPTPVAAGVANLLEELERNESQMVMQVQRLMFLKNPCGNPDKMQMCTVNGGMYLYICNIRNKNGETQAISRHEAAAR